MHGVACLPDDSLVVAHERGWDCYRFAAGTWQLFGPELCNFQHIDRALQFEHVGDWYRRPNSRESGVFELFDLQSERRLEPTFREPNGVRAVAACPAKGLVAWATGHKENSKRELKVWDVRRQTPLRFSAPTSVLPSRWSLDGSAFAAAEEWTRLRLTIFL